jgi:hypothetical protein
MVRVGGGWADLGEYLRQYAEHHGRRTVSEGKFEVLGLEPPSSTTATTAAAAATSAAVRTAAADPSVRPGSAASKKDFRFAAGTPVGGRPATPGVTPGKASALDAAQLTPSITTTTPAAAVGESGGSSGSSGRVSWSGNEVGLAGPKAKKLDLSGEKLEWIEGMMNQARRVSGHVNASSTGVVGGGGAKGEVEGAGKLGVGGGGAGGVKGDFVDLGKVGGTKRLFLKNPANAGD